MRVKTRRPDISLQHPRRLTIDSIFIFPTTERAQLIYDYGESRRGATSALRSPPMVVIGLLLLLYIVRWSQ